MFDLVFVSLIKFKKKIYNVFFFNSERTNQETRYSCRYSIGITNLEKHFLNFIADTMNRFPNIMLG